MLSRHFFRSRLGLAALIASGVLLTAALVLAVVLVLYWPFTERKITMRLAHITGCRVKAERFRSHFVPWTGCTMENVTFSRGDNQVLARVQRLTIRTYFRTLLTFQKRASQIRADGLVVTIPGHVPEPEKQGPDGKGDISARELIADGAILNFAGEPGEETTQFRVRKLRLENLQSGSAMNFQTLVEIPSPNGLVRASGTFGPFEPKTAKNTPVKGKFELSGGDLAQFHGLAGTAGGKGSFEGPLRAIRIRGSALLSDFEVDRTGHPVELRAGYDAEVNASSGNVRLDSVDAQFRKTHLVASAAIGDSDGSSGKVITAEIRSAKAYIEDVLWLCTRSTRPAMYGPMSLQTQVVLPPGSTSFLRRLRLQGRFRIDNARWTKPQTQSKINLLSARARGEKDEIKERGEDQLERVLTEVQGTVNLRGGEAALTQLSLKVPGAATAGQGHFNVLTKEITLDGKVAMAADVSEATSGIKSFFVKPFDIFFRQQKRKRGALLPVRVRGKYPNPEFRVSLR